MENHFNQELCASLENRKNIDLTKTSFGKDKWTVTVTLYKLVAARGGCQHL
jgi:hypothetical protein